MSDDMEEYRQEFISEAREYLEIMNQNFVKLEQGDMEAIHEIFRVAHTIKGMAGSWATGILRSSATSSKA